MKNLLILITLIVLISCNKSGNLSGIQIDKSMDISFIDANGVDLLKMDHPNAFDLNSIKLYQQVNGVKTLYNAGPLMDYPNGIMHYCERPLCALRIFLLDTCYLELSNQITDTIHSEIVSSAGNTYVKNIWYNGELIYGPDIAVEKYFIIEK